MTDRDKRRGVLLLLTLCLFSYLSSAHDPATCIQCRKSHMCNPPDCFCCRDEMPIQDQKIPQMVFFTFDDAVNPPVASFYRELFDASRLNPNGCPIKMTLFISHASTVYSLVREFYEKGMEIASHSVNHRNPDPKTFLHEAKKQKENLVKKAKIPESEIIGWRSPFLKPLGDTQPDVLKELGYQYDATLTIIKPNSKDKAPIPFTLDYGWPYDCKIQPCPKKQHKGFWEVPVISVRDYLDKYNCVYIDGCNIPPPSEALAYQFLWDNFENYYKTNRAPMGINMHASWFYYPDRKKAMSKFIQDILKLGDVYIITVSQVIEWLRNPTPLSAIKDFGPWQCNGNSSAVPPKTVDLRKQTLKRKQQAIPPYQIALNRQEVSVTPRRPVIVRTMPTIPPTRPDVIYRQPLPTRTPTIVPTAFLQKMQNALVIRPAQSNIKQGVTNFHPVHTHGRPQMVNIRPQIKERISHLLPAAQVPLFPWTRQQFLQQTPSQPPLAPNYPVVRFWWRPPEMRSTHQPPGIHIVRPGQRTVSRQDILQQNMRRYQETESQRHLTRHQALKRQQLANVQLIKRQQELRRLLALRKQNEVLQRQELKRQRAERLQRQELLARQQEQEMKRKLMEQKELERQRQLEMKRQQELERLRLQEIRLREEKQKQEAARKAAEAQKQQKQIQVSQLFTRNRNRNKLQSRQKNTESQKIQQLKQLAESNFLKIQEMERRGKLPQTTTTAPRISPRLDGRTMWQMDTSALKQLNGPWRNWVTESPTSKRNNAPSHFRNMTLSEFKMVKVERHPKTRAETRTNFKPQTVFSVSDFKGSKSFSIFGRGKYSNKESTETIVQSRESTTSRSENAIDVTPTTTTHKRSINLPEAKPTIQLIAAASPTIVHMYTRKHSAYKKPTTPTSDISGSSAKTTTVESVPTTTTKVTMEPLPKDSKARKQSKPVPFDRPETNHIIYLSGRCIQGENCKLPECMCKQTSPPKGLLPQNTPQIVYITIDGNINFHTYSNIKKIFQKQRVNRNGCPIKGTLFATDSDSNYMIMKMLHSDGFEIAMKGLKSSAYKSSSTLGNDIRLQRKKLEKSANIPSADIKGWRSPDLKPLGDNQFEVLSNASLYDSTLIAGKDHRNGQKLWPFTLDYGWRETCEIEACPFGSHPGVWEVPIIPVTGPNNTRSCEYVDSCTNQPYGVEETADFLMNNFNQYYKTNRAPFAIRLQQVWFHWHYTKNLSGLNKFLDEILKLDDVFVITVSEMLDWMKSPTPLDKINSFQPWSC